MCRWGWNTGDFLLFLICFQLALMAFKYVAFCFLHASDTCGITQIQEIIIWLFRHQHCQLQILITNQPLVIPQLTYCRLNRVPVC